MNKDEPKLINLSDRLNYAIELTHTRKADLARAINVAPQVIQFLCSSKTQSSRFTFEIATALGLNTRWLATGEGEMFLADDPKQQLFKNFLKVPLLQFHQLKKLFLTNSNIEEHEILDWYPLKSNDKNIVAIHMPDSSMDPNIPAGSILFIKDICKKEHNEQDYVFSYLKKFDTFVVRKRVQRGTSSYLVPINSELFKEVMINQDVMLLGEVCGCFWHVRS